MRIGASVNPGDANSLAETIEKIRLIADVGLDTAWLPQVFGLDALTTLALAGREIPGIELGTSVVPTYPRHPISLAGQALTTQAAIGGRLVLGLGPSHQLVIEGMHGIPYARPAKHMREYVTVVRSLVMEGGASFTGETLTANTLPGGAKVTDAEPFPILIAALAPNMVKVAGEVADGTITWMTGPATLGKRIIPDLSAAAADAGRPEPRVVAGFPLCVASDPAAVRERVGRQFGFYGTLPAYARVIEEEGVAGPADLAIVGDAAAVRAKLEELKAIGITDLWAAIVGPPEDREATLAVLAEMVQ